MNPIDVLMHRHIENGEPLADEEEIEAVLGTLADLHKELSEASLIVAALAVYGEGASLPALVARARAINDGIGSAVELRKLVRVQDKQPA
jgi:hypothetical protein